MISSAIRLARAVLFLLVLGGATRLVVAQSHTGRIVIGGMNAEFTVSNHEKSIAFYHDVLGLTAPARRINPALPAVGQLTGTVTGAAHVASLPIPGAAGR